MVITIFITLLCLASRIMFAGRYIEGWDSVDFALALHDYDLTFFQPHFPGYILYIAFGRLSFFLTNNDVTALILPNVIFGTITVIPLFLLTKKMFSRNAAILATILYTLNPLCWLQSERPMPDTTGLFFIILSVQLMYFSLRETKSQTRYMAAGSFVLGIALGVKLSFFPFVLTWLFILYLLINRSISNQQIPNKEPYRKILLYSIGSFVVGLSVWILPLITSVGMSRFLVESHKFVYGHFSDWGESVYTQGDILLRVKEIYWSVFVNGFGFWWTDTHIIRLVPTLVIAAVSAISLYFIISGYVVSDSKSNLTLSKTNTYHDEFQPARTKSLKWKFKRGNRKWIDICFILALVLPYLTWIFLGQNLGKPRHALPLIPIFLILISAGIIRLNLQLIPKMLIIFTLLISFGTISTQLIFKHKNTLPTQLQLINHVRDNFNKHSTRIYCWETKRLFEYYEPSWDIRRVRNITDLEDDMDSSLTTPEFVLCTSKIEGLKDYNENLDFVKKFKQDRYIDNIYDTLELYRLDNNL
ncbi:MAG: ArnT family glycosyltransferase [Candidatus Anammoxibacter sp.]